MSNVPTNVVDLFRRRTRSPLRPRSSDLIQRIFPTFRRAIPYSPALILGEVEEWGHSLFVIAQQKPKPENLRTKEDLAKLNHGMLTADDHSQIARFLKRAVQRSGQGETVAIVTLIDTYGADISMESARHFQAFFIAMLIRDFLTIPLPTVSVIIGEGGSGGALAIQMTDRRAQFDDALYATAPPESLAAIIFRDPTKVREALLISKPTAAELQELGIIDQVLAAPKLVNDIDGYAKPLAAYLEKTLRDLARRNIKTLLRIRRNRAKAFGVYKLEPYKKSSRWTTFFRLTPLRRKAVPTPDLKTFHLTSQDIQSGVEWGEQTDPATNPEQYVKCGDMSIKAGGTEEGCGAIIRVSEFMANHYVCPKCGVSRIMGAMGWINCLTDPGSFQEMSRDLTAHHILHPSLLTPEYLGFLTKQDQRSPFHEGLVTGEATIFGLPVALAICEFYFAGGTMGVVFGEKFFRLAEYARDKKLPLISLCCSGGARLLEGTPALMQMVKTVNCVTRLKRDGLPFISVLGDPSTGGAIASYAALGDVILAEPNALVIFTGPRVMEARGFQVNEEDVRAAALCRNSRQIYENMEFYSDIRGIHEIAERRDLKATIFKYLEYYHHCTPISNRYWNN
ncbi:MAG: acetyl-CoA carboxylase carboxyl transferase subunit alpha/beta [Deltaproteobacteria bacterium]|jgi:acetyl-CoA carboxylase carboxyl transferase beta subunit|nr:acetyl-CoA carboxylase carboxyl transferase subunit alpha/beta [Deltaproteobacteria bacterium]MDR1308829.1 acetyl-CoA carboxylase carboxyl transferase subunit alpha/beta [Deltaproteobacteria bacterium]